MCRQRRGRRLSDGRGPVETRFKDGVTVGATSRRVMRFRILGSLEVLDGQQTVRLGAAKQRTLLAVLLLHANEPVSTDRLIDELWGERAPATADKLVQGYVHALRRQLGAEVLRTRPPGYEIRVDADGLDLLEFERLIAEARTTELERLGRAPCAGPCALARSPAGRRRPRGTRAQHGGAPDRIAAGHPDRANRCRARARSRCDARRRARVARRRQSLPGAPARSADAGAVPLWTAGGRIARLPVGSTCPQRRAGTSARPGAAGARGRDSPPGRRTHPRGE